MQPFNRQKNCRRGPMLYNFHDKYIGQALELYGEFSEGEVDMFRQMVRPGQVVLEIGANIGAHTVFFSQQVGPSGQVIAFEPQRVVFQTLCANVALNSLTNVFAFQQAVGDKPGTIIVPPLDYSQDNNFGGLALGGFEYGEQVQLVTVDGLALKRCHMVKIDVEGMERAVLGGAVETLTRLKPLLYVENDRVEKSDELVRFIDSLGYGMYWHKPPLFNPQNFLQNPVNHYPGIVSKNMVCVHRSVTGNIDGFEPVVVPS